MLSALKIGRGTVLQCFGQMVGLNGFAAVQISDASAIALLSFRLELEYT